MAWFPVIDVWCTGTRGPAPPTWLEERAGLCLLSSDPIVLTTFCYSDYSDHYSDYCSDYSDYELTALCWPCLLERMSAIFQIWKRGDQGRQYGFKRWQLPLLCPRESSGLMNKVSRCLNVAVVYVWKWFKMVSQVKNHSCAKVPVKSGFIEPVLIYQNQNFLRWLQMTSNGSVVHVKRFQPCSAQYPS